MEEKIFNLKNDKGFIQLNNLLQILDFAQTGGHAKIIILNGEVLVTGNVEQQIRKKLKAGDVVELYDTQITIEEWELNKI